MLSVKIGHYHPSLENSFVNTIQTLKKDDPLTPLLVVAPTNWMLNRLQERLAQGHDTSFMNISFTNFSVLANEICRRSGIEVGQVIQQPVIYESIIAGLLKQHTPQGSLFENVQSLPAIAKALFQVVQDLTDANVQVNDLKEAVQEGFVEGMEIQKLHEVIHLYDMFQQRLKTLNISHHADVFRTATPCVQDSGFLRGFKHILAYGFYDLTGVEQDFFGEIFRTCPVILFLPYQKKHTAFSYVKPFFESFVLGLAHDVEELPFDNSVGFSCLMDSQSEDNSVAGCESQVLGHGLNTQRTKDTSQHATRNTKLISDIRIINASGKRDEVWTVAKEILKLVDEGYKMEEIGVVARTLEPYTEAIKKIFQENYIPFITSSQEPPEKYPLVKVIQQTLLLKREDFYRPLVIELLGSPYFKIPPCDPKGVTPRPDLWDILSRRLNICDDITCWLSRLEHAKVKSVESVALDNGKKEDTGKEETSPYSLPCEGGARGSKDRFPADEETGRHIHIPIDQIELLKNILCTLSSDLSSIPEKATWTIMGQKTTDFLKKYIHMPSDGMNPEDKERDLLILDLIQKILRTLCTLDCLGEEVIRDQFIDTFVGACQEGALPIGLRNGRGVNVLDAMTARGIPFRALFVLGLNEKVFPRAISEEPFLRDHVRRRLSEVLGNVIPEKLRGFDEERLLFSFLLNAAQERLYLLHERSDEAGKPKVQSHYLMDIFQNMKSTSAKASYPWENAEYEVYVPRGIKDKLCRQEMSLLIPKEVGIRMAVDRIDPDCFMKAFGINRDMFDRSQSALSFMESYNSHLTSFDGVVGDMSGWLNEQAYRGFSPTTLETFGTCPFKYFMSNILELKSQEEPETAEMIAAVELGILYHNILRDVYTILIEKRYFDTKGYKLNSVEQHSDYQKTHSLLPPLQRGDEGGVKKSTPKKNFLPCNPTELLHSIAQEYFAEIEQQIPIQYPIIWEIEKEEMLDLLTRFLSWDIEHIEQTGYVPMYIEKTAKLSPQNDLHKLIPEHFKRGDTSKITFKGKIDRIDVKKGDHGVSFRVLDYKSGRFIKENLIRAAIRGQKLQIPFYIILAEHLLSEEIKKSYIPPGQVKLDEASFVYVAQDMEEKNGHICPQKKTISNDDWMECKEQYWETLKEFFRIIREGILPVSPAEDTQKCEWCDFATTCRRGQQPLRFRVEQDARLKKYREIMNLSLSKRSNKP